VALSEASALWPQDCKMAGRITKVEETEMAGNRGSTLLIFLTGLGAGIAVTALLAPRSGAATRRLLGRKVERGKHRIQEQVAAAQDYVKGQGEELRDRIRDVAGRN
jgi:gas vesicle protein